MITRIIAVAALGALLAGALAPAPAGAYDAPVVGSGAGVAAVGLAALLLGSRTPRLIYPAPPVVSVAPQRPAPPPRDDRHDQ